LGLNLKVLRMAIDFLHDGIATIRLEMANPDFYIGMTGLKI
jgi:hypothetical protein